jgi:hypothetical protein
MKPFNGLQSGSGGSARASCETTPNFWLGQQCLAVIYEKLKRHADAEAELSGCAEGVEVSLADRYLLSGSP